MTRQDANFAFDGVAPFNPYVLPMDQVEAMIAAHKAAHPGPYRLKFDPAHMEARRVWAEEMDRLDHLKANAIMFGTAPKAEPASRKGMPIQCQKAALLQHKMATKTAETVLAHARNDIAEMGKHTPGCLRWRVLQRAAQRYIRMAKGRATGLLDIPVMPPNPERKQYANPVGSPLQVKGMVDRLIRYQAKGERRNATSLRCQIRKVCREFGLDLPAEAA